MVASRAQKWGLSRTDLAIFIQLDRLKTSNDHLQSRPVTLGENASSSIKMCRTPTYVTSTRIPDREDVSAFLRRQLPPHHICASVCCQRRDPPPNLRSGKYFRENIGDHSVRAANPISTRNIKYKVQASFQVRIMATTSMKNLICELAWLFPALMMV